MSYKMLGRIVSSAVDGTDPLGLLAAGCPSNEYDLEIEPIAIDLDNMEEVDEAGVLAIVNTSFVEMFGPEVVGTKSCQRRLAEAARRIYSAIESYYEPELAELVLA